MILVEECRLRLDEPVDRLLPELVNCRVLKRLEAPLDDTVPANRPITLRDLLTFRLGFGIIMAPPDTYPIQKATSELGQGPPAPASVPAPDEWMRRFGTLPLLHQPGEKWMYHTGSDVLGVLIARASGQPLEAFLRERIFAPLGMKDTGFSVPAAKIDRLATSYWNNFQTGALEVFDEARGGQWSRPPAFPSAGGGLVSTIDDYLAFGQMMLNKGNQIDLEVNALVNMAYPLSWIGAERCLVVVDRALRLSTQQPNPLQRARTRASCLVRRIWAAGWNTRDAQDCREAVEEIRRSGDRILTAAHLIDSNFIRWTSSEYRAAHQDVVEGLAVLVDQNMDNPYLSFAHWLSQFTLPWSLLFLGEWGDALRILAAEITLADKNGDRYRGHTLQPYQAWIHLHAMDFPGVLEICNSILPSLEEGEEPVATVLPRADGFGGSCVRKIRSGRRPSHGSPKRDGSPARDP
jgi:CubicO group peptidase (beta-lactamase class C family)